MTAHHSEVRQRPISVVQLQALVIKGLRALSLLTIIWGEVGTYLWTLWTCRWPDNKLQAESPAHILLVSDPQVQYPLRALESDASLLGPLRQFLYDSNLRKNWYIARQFKPDAVIFLGDMLASGKYAEDQAEFNAYAQKFDSIFRGRPELPMYFIPGNNDVGMGTSPSITKHARQLYTEHFGAFNQRVSLRNHTFILLDAPGLVDEDYQRTAHQLEYDEWQPLPQGPIEFVKDIKERYADGQPILLFSHIPLARPDVASCGPLRERGTIRRNVGHGYQNTLGKQTTTFLLRALQPSGVFSGDNRDYCDYLHKDPEGKVDPVREITVKSFSPTRHIHQPGFQLLSLTTPKPLASVSKPSFADRLCLLPGQDSIYTGPYLFLAVMSFFAILATNIHRARRQRRQPLSPISLTSRFDGRNSPTMQPPDSGIWSPYTPTTPYSPMSKFPPMRTSTSSTAPTMRIASRPSSPFGTPSLSPMLTPTFDEDTEDGVYISQYALDMGLTEADEERHVLSSLKSPLLPSSLLGDGPGWRTADKMHSRSWTFVFRGRRRRITFSIPAAKSLLEYVCAGDGAGLSRRRTLFRGVITDYFSVIWPSCIVWCLITWWISY